MTALLEAKSVALGQRLAALDFASEGGEMIALVGPNGGGKTSLLRALAGVEGADGSARIDGESLDGLAEVRRRRLLAFLPASREIAWPIAVRDVIALGLAAREHGRIEALLGAFELHATADRLIGSLSTGERARVLLARALAAEPRLLLLDEPLSNLDPYWVLRTMELLTAAARGGATVMVALHDIALVDRFDRLLLLAGGMIVGDGPPSALKAKLGALFGVEEAPSGGWQISPSAGPRSSR
ncbi:ABC transporter ATP-binding protein [Sphingomonas sp.]|uniref:ABC transporter ATP-binding protein n=1 Tax=Sphingomonas sp. TaxID=28214 RepID=UPI00286C0A91|nr:ABC transporter ATP-binding protein [Sphingomonas sp.]